MPAYGLEGGLACSDHPAPPGRNRLAPAADALTGSFASRMTTCRPETRPGLEVGVVPPGFGFLWSSTIDVLAKEQEVPEELAVLCGGTLAKKRSRPTYP